jgi:hypothetical protein
MEDTNQFKKECHEYYKQRREELKQIRYDSINSFDRVILFLSSGALVITITFIEKIGRPYNFFTNILLILAWLSYLAVIILNLISFRFAIKNAEFAIRDLDRRYKISPFEWTAIKEKVSKYKNWTECCNSWSFRLFLVASFIFVFYAIMVQINEFKKMDMKEKSMTEKDKSTNEGKTKTKEIIIEEKRGLTQSPERVIIQPKKPKGKK